MARLLTGMVLTITPVLIAPGIAWTAEFPLLCRVHPLSNYKVDRMTGEETVYTHYSRPFRLRDLDAEPDAPTTLTFGFGFSVSSSGFLAIGLYYHGPDWIFIDSSAPLRTKSNGAIYEHLALPGGDNSDVLERAFGDIGVAEMQLYIADRDGIVAFAADSDSFIRATVKKGGYYDLALKGLEEHQIVADWITKCVASMPAAGGGGER